MMYNNRVHLQGGGAGGGNYMQQMKQDKKLAERKEARKGNFKDTDAMYSFLVSGADPIYREEAFRDTDFQDYHKALGKDSLAYKDANTYKSAILKAGDPRGIFTGKITDPKYGTPNEVALSQSYLDHFNRMTSALGMDAANMAAGVQPQTVLSTFPGANPQPTAAPSEPAPPVLPAMTAADRGYKPFMTMDEGQEYYGQFMANGGVVPNTLRRKMFSLGGNVPGHHGVGITSGMRYNKGGSVKPGPDGRPRVHAGYGAFLANAALYGIPRAAQVAKGLFTRGKDFLRYGDKGLKAIDDKADEILEASRKYKKRFGKDPFIKAKSRQEILEAMGSKELARQAGVKASRGLGQAGRLASGLGPAALAAGVGSAMFPDDTPETRGEQYGRGFFESYVDYSGPGLLKAAYDNINTPVGEDVDYQSITSAIKGINPSGEEASEITPGEETVAKAVARMSEEDRLRQDFETRKALYEELMSSDEKTNNLGVLGRSLLEASEALNQGKGFISAGNVFGTGIADEVDRREQRLADIRDAAATQAITDVMGSRAQREAAVQEAVLTGNTEYVRILDAVDAAQAAGIPLEDVPTDGNEEDVEAMKKRPGTVFMDTQNLIGQGIFVAVNSRGDIRSFNDVNTAIEFAST